MAKNEVQYLHEHLWIGELGHFLIIVIFVSSLLSVYSNYKANKLELQSWSKLGGASFMLSAFSTILVAIILFYILSNHLFEFYYVFANTSETLPTQFVFSAFWKDQEGSILTWMFWNAIIGLSILFGRHRLKAGVLSFLSLFHGLMASMLLGVILKDGEEPVRAGLNPFRLLRFEFDAPIFSQTDYLELIQGQGLNPALQNYWMTIHPPTLFFGFALTSVPIAFAVSAIWKKDMTGWVKTAYRWALFTAAILGIGILMGSAWAYEALNFGGYWAWDPVENMSLVPWLLLIAGLHTNLISMRTGRSYLYTYVFYALSMLGVLYSTYLTKSGVLGDTSVHSFTEMGLSPQMLLMIAVFLVVCGYTLIKNRIHFPRIKSEEPFWSREFWLFLGTLTLILSSALITFTTSVPVFNKLIDLYGSVINSDISNLHRTAPTDPAEHHNRFQIWIALLILMLSSIATYLRWNEKQAGKHLKSVALRLAAAALLAILLTVLINRWMGLSPSVYLIALWASSFALLANLDLIFLYGKSNWKKLATSLSHLGFAIMMLGILFSGIMKRHISSQPFMFKEIMDEGSVNRSVYLIRDKPLLIMDNYLVTYASDTLKGKRRYYQLNFDKIDSTLTKREPAFSTTPYILYNEEFTKMATTNPGTKHYWDRDIFTTIISLPTDQIDAEEAKKIEDSLSYGLFNMTEGDTLYTMNYYGVVGALSPIDELQVFDLSPEDQTFGLNIDFHEISGDDQFDAELALVLRPNGLLIPIPYRSNEAMIKLKLDESLANPLFAHDDSLHYVERIVSQGENFEILGEDFVCYQISQTTSTQFAEIRDDDIAITAQLVHSSGDTLRPIFLIRDKRIIPIRDYNPDLKISAKLIHVDPETERFTFAFARNTMKVNRIPIRMAENIERDDYLVLEAIVFPGINLFWLGTTLMMLGFIVALLVKRKSYQD